MSESAEFEAAFTSAVERAARELSGEREAAVNDHPEVEELVDFQEGRLTDDDAERVRQHLEACAECQEELQELASFDDPPDAELLPSSEQTAADWERFQEQIAREASSGDQAGQGEAEPLSREPTATPTPTVARPRPAARWLPMAASLIIGLIGGLWIASRDTPPVETSSSPQDPYAIDLVPDGEDLVRDAATLRDVAVPEGMDGLVARLNLGDQTPYDAYRAEIADATGTIAWSRDGLRRQPAGEFLLLVDRTALPAGKYRLSVLGLEDSEETVLATYTFELSYAAEP